MGPTPAQAKVLSMGWIYGDATTLVTFLQNHDVGPDNDFRFRFKGEQWMAAAAYNLAVILSKDRLPEAIEWCRKARDANAAEPKYAYTRAFYLNQSGKPEAATRLLADVIARSAEYLDAYVLLASICEARGERERAAAVSRRALSLSDITPQTREMLTVRLAALAPDRRR